MVEMASASGLEKVPLALRNPLHTTTEGTGQLIQHAFDEGHSHIIVGMVRAVCRVCRVCRVVGAYKCSRVGRECHERRRPWLSARARRSSQDST